jgi:hypothetical protein
MIIPKLARVTWFWNKPNDWGLGIRVIGRCIWVQLLIGQIIVSFFPLVIWIKDKEKQ